MGKMRQLMLPGLHTNTLAKNIFTAGKNRDSKGRLMLLIEYGVKMWGNNLIV